MRIASKFETSQFERILANKNVNPSDDPLSRVLSVFQCPLYGIPPPDPHASALTCAQSCLAGVTARQWDRPLGSRYVPGVCHALGRAILRPLMVLPHGRGGCRCVGLSGVSMLV